jgi:hypothetical protein
VVHKSLLAFRCRLLGETIIRDLFQGGFEGSSKWFQRGRYPLNHRGPARSGPRTHIVESQENRQVSTGGKECRGQQGAVYLLDMDRALQSKKTGADGNAQTGRLAPLVALR